MVLVYWGDARGKPNKSFWLVEVCQLYHIRCGSGWCAWWLESSLPESTAASCSKPAEYLTTARLLICNSVYTCPPYPSLVDSPGPSLLQPGAQSRDFPTPAWCTVQGPPSPSLVDSLGPFLPLPGGQSETLPTPAWCIV